jgi:hypothetical protein
VETASDIRYDSRFDANFLAQTLLEIAPGQSLAKLLQKLTERAIERPHIAFGQSQIWLIEKGDLGATCPRRPEYPDKSRCLHLVAGRGKSISASGKIQCPFEDLDSRVPLGVGPIGEAVATREPKSVTHADKQPSSLPGLEWRRRKASANTASRRFGSKESRSLVAYQCGATGPRKDYDYENPHNTQF